MSFSGNGKRSTPLTLSSELLQFLGLSIFQHQFERYHRVNSNIFLDQTHLQCHALVFIGRLSRNTRWKKSKASYVLFFASYLRHKIHDSHVVDPPEGLDDWVPHVWHLAAQQRDHQLVEDGGGDQGRWWLGVRAVDTEALGGGTEKR